MPLASNTLTSHLPHIPVDSKGPLTQGLDTIRVVGRHLQLEKLHQLCLKDKDVRQYYAIFRLSVPFLTEQNCICKLGWLLHFGNFYN